MSRASRLSTMSLTVADLPRAERFYRDGLGFQRVAETRFDRVHYARLLGIDGLRARSVDMRLGRQTVELVLFDPPGRPYPAGGTSADLWFQHFAIVVADIRTGKARVAAQPGFAPISRGEPRRLPPASGPVTAFKFRDPDGHPLELLEFQQGAAPGAWRGSGSALFLGIDHSAISVADVATSIDFYARSLALSPGERSLNQGPEQAALDDLQAPIVDVVGLHAREPTPHLELLGYRAPAGRAAAPGVAPNDVAATRLVFEAKDVAEPALVRDPDGHYCVLAPSR
jgi:catechol 2,3-dioxygenase-like lactoylglutathione lyase family enzyme